MNRVRQAATPVAIVTGASSGFGEQLAKRLAREGYRVFGTSRRDIPSHEGVSMLRLDVRSDASVETCVGTVLERAGAVDVLVNNAGYVHEGPIEELTIGELAAVFETNFFGAARMVRAVLPSMRARRAGRIVNVSSLAGLMSLPFWGAYCASKHALEGYSESLRFELQPLGIHVSLVEPGFYRTAIAANSRRTAPTIAQYDPWRERMYAAVAREVARAPAPDAVIDLLMRVIEANSPWLRYRIGRFSGDYVLRGLVPERVWEWGVRRTLGLTRRDRSASVR